MYNIWNPIKYYKSESPLEHDMFCDPGTNKYYIFENGNWREFIPKFIYEKEKERIRKIKNLFK